MQLIGPTQLGNINLFPQMYYYWWGLVMKECCFKNSNCTNYTALPSHKGEHSSSRGWIVQLHWTHWPLKWAWQAISCALTDMKRTNITPRTSRMECPPGSLIMLCSRNKWQFFFTHICIVFQSPYCSGWEGWDTCTCMYIGGIASKEVDNSV